MTTMEKKSLPKVPEDANGEATVSPLKAVKITNTEGQLAAYGPFFLEYALMSEYNLLRKQRLPGLYVLPSEKSPLHWFGVLFIRQGIYQEGVFKFELSIPENYPDGDCPSLRFTPPIFHPMIDPDTGVLEVKKTFSKWRRGSNHIWQVLLFARRVFYKIDTTEPLNPEAADLYENDLELFKSRVHECVLSLKEHLYDPVSTDDQHAIVFSPWEEELHRSVHFSIINRKQNHLIFFFMRKTLEESEVRNAQYSGLSWIDPGSLQPFSRV